jgi:hypothetical protein
MSDAMEEIVVTHGLHGIIECTPSRIEARLLAKQDGLPECDGTVNDVHIWCHLRDHRSAATVSYGNCPCSDVSGDRAPRITTRTRANMGVHLELMC